MKTKPLLSTLCIACFASMMTVAHAGNAKRNFTGPFVGAGVGINGAVNDTKYTEPSDKDGPFYFTTGNITDALSTSIGYGFAWHHYRLTPEIFALYSPEKTKSVTEVNKYYFNHLQTDLTWGFQATFDRMLTNHASLGLLVGLQSTQFNFNLTNEPGNPSDTYNQWRWGWMAGVDSKIMLTHTVSLNVKAMYLNYGCMVSHGSEQTITEVKPTNIIGLIGINYYF